MKMPPMSAPQQPTNIVPATAPIAQTQVAPAPAMPMRGAPAASPNRGQAFARGVTAKVKHSPTQAHYDKMKGGAGC